MIYILLKVHVCFQQNLQQSINMWVLLILVSVPGGKPSCIFAINRVSLIVVKYLACYQTSQTTITAIDLHQYQLNMVTIRGSTRIQQRYLYQTRRGSICKVLYSETPSQLTSLGKFRKNHSVYFLINCGVDFNCSIKEQQVT